jgi:hypothetical protein
LFSGISLLHDIGAQSQRKGKTSIAFSANEENGMAQSVMIHHAPESLD